MTLPSVTTGITVSTRKLAFAALLASSTFALWFWTRNGLLACVLLLFGTIGAATAMRLAGRRRAAVADARERQVRARLDYLADIATHLDLDRRLIAALGPSDGQGIGIAPRIGRTPMQPGNSSHVLNRVEVSLPGRAPVELVEKGVDTDGNEHRFWRDRAGDFVLRTGTYRSLVPITVLEGSALTVLYFRYVGALDRERRDLRRAFRDHLVPIAVAVADLNGNNLVSAKPGRSEQPAELTPFAPARPTVDQLQRWLSVSRREARTLLQYRDEIEAGWAGVRAAYQRLPRSLCHYDVSPGNTVHADGMTTFSDFGLATVGPVGSDLHTLIRWSGPSVAEPGHTDVLMQAYLDRIHRYIPDLTLDDLVLSAWTTYYLRYTSLRLPSARHRHAYTLALHRMAELIERHG